MSIKKWFLSVTLFALTCSLLLMLFNVAVDPFGVFGDKLLNDYAYNMNNNPRVAKIAYLDQHHERYNAYIIGGSKSSALSPIQLNQYHEGLSFYNMIMYGGDFYDYEKTIQYLVDNYNVEHVILHMSMQEMGHYNQSPRNIHTELSPKVLEKNPLLYYLKYMTLNLEHTFSKLESYIIRKRDPLASAVFIPETGVYNKSVRDLEDLGDLESYLEKYPEFNAPLWPIHGTHIDDNLSSLSRIVDLLDSKNIAFTFIAAPTHHNEMVRYAPEDIERLWQGIAEITDFWDFTGYNTIAYDSRKYYDRMHYRYEVGHMMLDYMYGNGDNIPFDFGNFTTKDSVQSRILALQRYHYNPLEDMKIHLPIVMYHHFVEEDDGSHNVSRDKFEQDLLAYKNAGFKPIHFKDLFSHIDHGTPLPEKPMIISIDDGYLSNYEIAFPLLEKYQMKAVISKIGWSVGEVYYKDTDLPIIPHFSWEQAKEMIDSGLVEIQNHSHDLHDLLDDDIPHRKGVLQKENETFLDYVHAIYMDTQIFEQKMIAQTGERPLVFTYPYGFNTPLSEAIFRSLGYRATVTVDEGPNVITADPRSLYLLKRYNAPPWRTSDALVDLLRQKD